MTIHEFSDLFDTLVSSYRRFKDFDNKELLDSVEFNEYEKSVFLTKALEDIVKELYTGKYTGESYETTEKLRRELELLVTQASYTSTDSVDSNKLTDNKYTHTVFNLPENCLYIVYEQVSWSSDNTCLNGYIADVVPTTHDEFWRIRNNPFRGPNKRRVLRLDNGDSKIELVSSNTLGSYTIRYLKKPEPIILVLLPDVTIEGVNTPQTCKLSESIHKDILDRAVRIALLTKISKTKDDGE